MAKIKFGAGAVLSGENCYQYLASKGLFMSWETSIFGIVFCIAVAVSGGVTILWLSEEIKKLKGKYVRG